MVGRFRNPAHPGRGQLSRKTSAMYRKSSRKPRLIAISTALLAALGGVFLMASPASAATIFRVDYSSQYAQGYTSTISPDGCTFTSLTAGAGETPGGGSTMFYSASSFNKCTGVVDYSVYGEAPTQTFSFSRNSVHAVATVPLSDGSQIYLDLTFQGTGLVERGGSSSRDILPGKFVQRVSVHGTFQEAVVTGTLSLENGFISQNKGSSMMVEIDHL
jgi:hypothetical protein